MFCLLKRRVNDLASSPHATEEDDGIIEQTDTLNPEDDNEPFAG